MPTFVFSQNRDFYGQTFAECSAYNWDAFTIATKLFKDSDMAAQRAKLSRENLDFAAKLIGNKRATDISSNILKTTRVYQSNPEAYVNYVGKHIQECDNFIINNVKNVQKLLGQ